MDQKRDTCLPTSLEGLYLKRALKLWLGIYCSCVKFSSPPMSHLFCSTTGPLTCWNKSSLWPCVKLNQGTHRPEKLMGVGKNPTFLPYQLLDLTHSLTTQNMMLSNWVVFHSEGTSTKGKQLFCCTVF